MTNTTIHTQCRPGAVATLLVAASLALAGLGVIAAAPSPPSAGGGEPALLPDVVIRPLTEIRIQKREGVKLLRFASIIGNRGAGVVELQPDSQAALGRQRLRRRRRLRERPQGVPAGVPRRRRRRRLHPRGRHGVRQAVRRLLDVPRRAQPLALRGVRALPAREAEDRRRRGRVGEGLVLRARQHPVRRGAARVAPGRDTTATAPRTR